MFKHAIVRKPGRELTKGITSANLGPPDYRRALEQHAKYVDTLTTCGLEVTILEADERYPDGTFVEDTAVLTEECAVITNPGMPTRKGEVKTIEEALKNFYHTFEYIREPGTLEGGDVMRVGDHFFIGISERTNKEGAEQLITILEKRDYTRSAVPIREFLHLKSGVAYLENNNLLAAGEFIEHPAFAGFHIIPLDDSESYAANCIWVNDFILVPKGFDKTRKTIEKAGYPIKEVDVSEFRKLDGGLSCLSLRF